MTNQSPFKVFISTFPFGDHDKTPLDLLKNERIDYVVNPYGRKITEVELANLICDYDAIIAGTEPITKEVLKKAKKLKLISRVGIGLDGIDLNYARNSKIAVSYTPDAPAPAVAEYTIGLMLSSLRSIHLANEMMHSAKWNRYFGSRLANSTVGIIGMGRIGQRVLRHLEGFQCKKILINDLDRKSNISEHRNVFWATKDEIYESSDIISLHIPLNKNSLNTISSEEFKKMKQDVILINTSRGGIINEEDLKVALIANKIGGAAIDVFEQEPYKGGLISVKNCLLSSHMGSMTFDCRAQMEIEATEEVLRFYRGQNLINLIPEYEYENQEGGKS